MSTKTTRNILRHGANAEICGLWLGELTVTWDINNFAEVTVRLYKDVVLGRVKAYNAVSLVDFTVQVMEDYYLHRLRDFANGRISAQRLAMEKLSKKASYLTSSDQIDDYGDNRYGVPNSDGTEKYDVDVSLGCCSCKMGILQTSACNKDIVPASISKCTIYDCENAPQYCIHCTW